MVLDGFERRVERLVTGVFSKAFRSGVQPIEIGRRMLRELEGGCQITPRGTVAPNFFEVRLSPEDDARFDSFRDVLANELAETAREHAKDHQYRFVGPVNVNLVILENSKRGDYGVRASIVQAAEGWYSTIVMADGRRVALSGDITTIGRMQDCAIQLSDSQSSRYHAEIRSEHDGFRIVDLSSTNGTFVNGTAITEVALHDGDEIMIGACRLRYEER